MTKNLIQFLKIAPTFIKGNMLLALIQAAILVSFISASTVCLAETNQALDSLLKDIETRVTQTKTVQALFQQERHLSLFSKPVIFDGRLLLSRPDNLRWEIVSPIPSVLIFSGDRGLRCSGDMPPQKFDLQNDPIMRMVAEQLWTWADGAYGKLKKEYDIALIKNHEIEMRPKNETMRQSIQAIRVIFDPETLQPRKVTVVEPAGDTLIIKFHDYQLNKSIDLKAFAACS